MKTWTRKSAKSKAQAKADKYFSLFIRLRYANEQGYAVCCTCKRQYHYTEMDCGHFMSREHENTRYDCRNAHAQCKKCNRFKNGMQYEHGLYIDNICGEGTAFALRNLTHETVKRTEEGYEYFAKLYREKFNQRKKELGV